jgi:hypothetical protein
MRENIMRFQGNQKSPYLKITMNDHKMVTRVRTMVQQGNANWKGLWGNIRENGLLTFDIIPYVQRFMVDTSVSMPCPIETLTDSIARWHVLGRSTYWEIQVDLAARATFELPNRSPD